MQHKNAYMPEVIRRIVWAIIMDTRSFFDDIKLADDFVEQGAYMQFSAYTLWREITCLSIMGSKSKGTISPWNGRHQTYNWEGLRTFRGKQAWGPTSIPPLQGPLRQACGPCRHRWQNHRPRHTTGTRQGLWKSITLRSRQ